MKKGSTKETMETDQLVITHLGDKPVKFYTRSKPGADITCSDEIVIREMFVENVYGAFADDFKDTGVVVDIGANIGAFSIQAAMLGAKKVYAIEPESDNFAILKKNIEANGLQDIIKPINIAIGKEETTAMIGKMQGASSITGLKPLVPEVTTDFGTEEVRVITLEKFLFDHKITYADFLKVDCEGSEYPIIAAATYDVLKKFKKLSMEYHCTDTETFGYMLARLSKVFNLRVFGDFEERGGQLYGDRY